MSPLSFYYPKFSPNQIICLRSTFTIRHQRLFHPSWFDPIYRRYNSEKINHPTKLFLSSNKNSSHLQYSWSYDEQRNKSTTTRYTSTESSGKWIVLVKKVQKDQTRRSINNIINEKLFPDSQTERPGRLNRHNINSSLVTYAVSLQKESTLSTIQSLKHYKMRTHATSELQTT